jgi:hypothetical protein
MLQCSNIFLTKERNIRLGTQKNIFSHFFKRYLVLIAMYCKFVGDFGLAKMLREYDLASSVSNSKK